jgi:hypothetical protein
MIVDHISEYTTTIRLNNGKSVIIMHNKFDELTIAFNGMGQRNLKTMQNREDGYSSASFTKQE